MNKTLLTAAIALTGLAAFTSANAQSNGDAFIGFQATGGTGSTTNLVIDVGAATNLANVTINLAADLSAVYGTNWASDTNLYYGIIGGNYTHQSTNGDTGNVYYASIVGGGAAWLRASAAAQGNIVPNIANLAGGFTLDINNSQIGIAAKTVYMNNTEGGSWGSIYTTLSSQYFGLTGPFETSITNAVDVYRLQPAVGANIGTPGTLKATFAIATDGTVSSVPEPATYALFGLGALVLVIAARRRQA